MKCVRGVLVLVLGIAAVGSRGTAETVVLKTDSYFRAFVMCSDPIIAASLLPEAEADKPFGPLRELRTPPPPADWRSVAFDDSAWLRYRGPFPGRGSGWKHYRGIRGLLVLRSKFTVTDPHTVGDLSLRLRYRGGVVVYLNGIEVARGHLPAGELRADTPGDPFPAAAYVDASGRILGHRSAPADKQRAVAARSRELAEVVVPATLPRRGVNVLAVELHRSGHRPEVRKWTWNRSPEWDHIGLYALRLTAAGEGVVPAVSRPDGACVWNADIHQVLGADAWGDPSEPLKPIRLTCARNGTASGQVVVSIAGGVNALRATMGDLGLAGARVEVRFPRLTSLGISAEFFPRRGIRARPAFLPLRNEPEGKGKVQPVWITVHVPQDATPGTYRGELTLAADGLGATKVPVELEVVDWTLPDAKDFGTFMGFYQSPGTLAMHYGVEMGSQEHWRLIDESFRLGGYIGNRLLIVPLVCRTQFGNDDSLVSWVRKADGSYEYDFTAFDRYVETAATHCTLEVISCQVWTPYGGGYHMPHKLPSKPTFVTVVDESTKKRERMQLPAFGTPEALALWRPYILAVKARLARRRLATAMVLGIHSDSFGTFPVTEMFARIDPSLQWHKGCHGRGGRRGKGFAYAYREYLYVPKVIPPPGARKGLGWNLDERVVFAQRLYDPWQPPMMMRTLPQRALLAGERGAGRMCLDYWPVKGYERQGTIFNRWPASTSAQRRPFIRWMLHPGPDGPIATIKVETLREGMQDAEVRIFLEKALAAGTLSDRLAGRVRGVLNRMAALCRIVHSNGAYGVTEPLRVTHDVGYAGLSAELLRLAAEVAKTLKSI